MFTHKNKYLPYIMWFFPLLFFTFQFILRLWPGLMMYPIMDQFSIDASHFGMLAAFYYYGYAGMQIPVAIMLDRYSAKYIIFISALICGLATLLFTYTNNFYLAILSRFLIGAGSAVGFLGVSKITSQWFTKEQYTKIIGYSFTIGLMGAIYGGKPINIMIEKYSGHYVAIVLASISIIIGFATFIILNKQKTFNDNSDSPTFKMTNFKAILSSKKVWLLAIANLLMVGTLEGFADVWGVQYLMTAYDISKNDAASLTSLIFFGMLFGGPILAILSNKLGNYNVLALCGTLMTTIFMIILYCHVYDWLFLAALFFMLGIVCCYQVVVFAAGSDLVASQNLGVTVAFLNCINMFGGSFFHTIIGYLMDKLWMGRVSDSGLKLYELASFKYALLIIPTLSLVGAVIVFIIGLRKRNY